MQLRRLRTFIMVVEKRNFSTTAEVLGISQPAVSKQIKLLEEDLGITLLYRDGMVVEPTEVGRHLYKKARELLGMWDDIVEECRVYHGELTGLLRVGTSTVPGSYMLPNLLGQFRGQHPRVEVRVSIHDSEEIVRMIREGTIDIGIVGSETGDEGIVEHVCATDRLVLIGRSGSEPIAGSEDVTDLPIIFREQGSGTWDAVEIGLKKWKLEASDLNCVARVDSTEAVIAMVEAGIGYSFVSDLAAKPAANYGRIEILSELPGERQFRFVYPKTKQNHPIIAAFSKVILKE